MDGVVLDGLVSLAARAKSGDRGALEDLLAASAGLVHAVARGRLGETMAAEGAAVDALARAARSLRGLKDPQAYPHWLYRIALRCCADARWPAPRPLPERAEREDPAGGPVETLVAAERAHTVRAAVEALPRKLREPVFLHYVEGLAYREVAAVLDVGLGTVARRMERALSLLKERLGGDV